MLFNGADPKAVQAYMRETCNVFVGGGIGALNGKALRIAHMGHANAPMLLATLSAMEMALTALKVPHGAGAVDAAIGHLAKSA